MVRTLALSTLLMGCLVAQVAGAALLGAKNLATGVHDATGSRLPARVHDIDWSWEGPTTTRYLFVEDDAGIPPSYLSDEASTDSRWLHHGETSDGSFEFEMRVDLEGFDPASARIEGLRIAADRWLRAVRVNGSIVFQAPPEAGEGGDHQSFREIGTAGLGAFVAGSNTVTVEGVAEVDAGISPTPVGLRVEGWVVAELVDPGARKATFEGLGDLAGGYTRSLANAVSADGSTVVGTSGSTLGEGGEAYRWRRASGMEGLGCVEGFCATVPVFDAAGVSSGRGVSADGDIVAGVSNHQSMGAPCLLYTKVALFTWNEVAGFDVVESGERFGFEAFSADASALVGSRALASGTVSGCPYDGRHRLFVVPDEPAETATLYATERVWPFALTPDGRHIIGGASSILQPDATYSFVWDWGQGGYPAPLGDFWPVGSSPDAGFMVGSANGLPVLWSADEGLRPLDVHPDSGGQALHVTVDGDWVFGVVRTHGVEEWVIWVGQGEPRPLREWLESEHGLDLESWEITSIVGLSNDRRTIVGDGKNPEGHEEAWIISLPVEPSAAPEPSARLCGLMSLVALASLRTFGPRAGARARGRSGRPDRAMFEVSDEGKSLMEPVPGG